VGTQGGDLDFALLLDGLEAEREQGITIDVAYRFISTARRKFIVADTPGHEQYTRNMVTGASTAQAAVILVDARKGVLTQTRRHSYLVSLLGIRHVVLAVNKLDLAGYDPDTLPPSKPSTAPSPPISDFATWCASRCRRSRVTTFFIPAPALPGITGPPSSVIWKP
jgi:bifunctional enzyme CysN/CysC